MNDELFKGGLEALSPEQQQQYLDSVRDQVWNSPEMIYHKKVITEERAPCGTVYTIEYFDDADALLKRDILVSATKPLSMGAQTSDPPYFKQSHATVNLAGIAPVHPLGGGETEIQELAQPSTAPMLKQSNQR